jgi:hypothetical protein
MPHACFSYPADMPRRGWLACFSYSVDPPLRVRNRDAAQPTEPGLLHCFSYSAGAPLGVGNRNTVQPGPDDHPRPPGGNSGFVSSACMTYPVYACFRY